MTGLVRKATMLVACGVLLGATVAMAGVPSPGNSTSPTRINLVGFAGSLADSGTGGLIGNTITKVQVIVRDLANNPVAGSTVVFDFSSCVTSAGKDVKVSDTQHYQGLAVACATKRVTGFSDATGTATFVIEGGGAAGATAHTVGCGKIYADNVLLTPGGIGVGMYNLDGLGAVGGADLSLFAADAFSATPNEDRSDYDGSGTVGGGDLSLFASIVFGSGSLSSGAACLP